MGSLASAPPGSPSPAQPSLWSHPNLRPEDSSWGVGGGGTEDLVLRKEEKKSGSAHTPPGVRWQERAGGGGAGRCRDAPPLPPRAPGRTLGQDHRAGHADPVGGVALGGRAQLLPGDFEALVAAQVQACRAAGGSRWGGQSTRASPAPRPPRSPLPGCFLPPPANSTHTSRAHKTDPSPPIAPEAEPEGGEEQGRDVPTPQPHTGLPSPPPWTLPRLWGLILRVASLSTHFLHCSHLLQIAGL